jgi:hypothetical protein
MNNHRNNSKIAARSFNSIKFSAIASLFSSTGTLICCALPAIFVALGAGTTLASLITAIPQLVWFSEHKIEVFLFAGAMLLLGGLMQWHARSLPCPTDPNLSAACTNTRRLSQRTYILSLALFCIGGFFAFVAPLLNA